MNQTMKLSVFCAGSGSYHQAGWRHPAANPDYSRNFTLWIDIARKLEGAKFDMMFVADLISPANVGQPDIYPYSAEADRFEPMTWLAALTGYTKHLGLAATIATSYRPPYDVAREVASLDLISGGRAAWNIVTGISPEDAMQYADQTFPPPEERYARGEEFVDVVLKLWDSFGPNAFPRDKASGRYAELGQIRLANHVGRYFKTRGPLNVERSPQCRPVLIQAGQSEEGRRLAGRVGEVVFTAQSTFEGAKAFRSDIRQRAARHGRNPDHVKVMPGLMFVVGDTDDEAERKWTELNSLIDLRPAMSRLQMALKFIDLNRYNLDEPFPDVPPEAIISLGINHVEAAKREGLTLRQVLIRSSGSNAHFTCRGTPARIADQMEHWFREGACDGFNLLIANMPAALDDFIGQVLPELRRRGLVRTEYEGSTLRENLGIPADVIPLLPIDNGDRSGPTRTRSTSDVPAGVA